MKKDNTPKKKTTPNPLPQNSDSFVNAKTVVPLYTGLMILLRIRKTLGLEAMLEYMTKYSEEIEKHNPEIKAAVSKALEHVSIKKVYREAVK